MDTMLLAVDTWDLITDANGNIALASSPYATAQDVASACRLNTGELWYDRAKGVPYIGSILGNRPPPTFVQSQLEKAALSVPGVAKVRCTFTGINNRRLTGQLEIVDEQGVKNNVQF